MDKITDLIERMRQAPKNVVYTDLARFATTISEKRSRKAQTIAYTRRPGMAIPA